MFQLHFQISLKCSRHCEVRFNLYQRSYCLEHLHLKQSLILHIYCIELLLQVDILVVLLCWICSVYLVFTFIGSLFRLLAFFSRSTFRLYSTAYLLVSTSHLNSQVMVFLSDLNDVCSTTGVVDPCVEFVKVHLVILYKFIGQQWNLEFQCV